MKTAAEFQRERDELEMKLSDLENLVAALQFICFDLCGRPFEPGSEAALTRDALVGIGAAMEARLERT